MLSECNQAEVPTHFHDDCLGGLKKFHDKSIASYANNLTIALAKENKMPVPQHGFDKAIELEVGAGKGFLGDANVHDWSATVQKVKQQYPDVKIVIPGHGETGGTKLLDYTIHLFRHQ